MKKKLLSIFAALVICLSPVLFLAGCTVNEDQGVTLEYTSWKVELDGSFASSTVEGLKITYYVNEYSKEDGEYRDVLAPEITTLSDAIANGLRVVEGFDSSSVGTKTMKVIFGGEMFTITYEVVDSE